MTRTIRKSNAACSLWVSDNINNSDNIYTQRNRAKYFCFIIHTLHFIIKLHYVCVYNCACVFNNDNNNKTN